LTQALSELNETHFAGRFNTFDTNARFIELDGYERHHAVIMQFTLEKFNLSVVGGKRIRRDVFVAAYPRKWCLKAEVPKCFTEPTLSHLETRETRGNLNEC
jgi:hypothetical protein